MQALVGTVDTVNLEKQMILTGIDGIGPLGKPFFSTNRDELHFHVNDSESSHTEDSLDW